MRRERGMISYRKEPGDIDIGLRVVIVGAERLRRPFRREAARAAVPRVQRIVAIVADESGVHGEEARAARARCAALDALRLIGRDERAAQIEELLREAARRE